MEEVFSFVFGSSGSVCVDAIPAPTLKNTYLQHEKTRHTTQTTIKNTNKIKKWKN